MTWKTRPRGASGEAPGAEEMAAPPGAVARDIPVFLQQRHLRQHRLIIADQRRQQLLHGVQGLVVARLLLVALLLAGITPTLAADTIRQILTHSESRLVFVGKLDVWPDMEPGVPADQRERILRRGERLDAQHPGQGIGTAVVKDIIESYGGELLLEDSALGGASFRVRLSE